jgi:hypothetical protein
MFDSVVACFVLAALCAGAWGGRVLFRHLPAVHRDRDTLDFARIASGLLVTFTALVLSLLLSTVNSEFRKTDADLRTYSAMITQHDGELRSFGPGADEVRALLRRYTAAAIASTWPDEPPPPGDYPRDTQRGAGVDSLALGDMLQQAEDGIRRLVPPGPDAERVQSVALARMTALLDQRWSLIGEAHTSLPPPLLFILLAWLVIVFFSFGMTAPSNAAAVATIGLVAASVAAAFFVILELDGPLDGVVQVSSEPLRHALVHLTLTPQAPGGLHG